MKYLYIRSTTGTHAIIGADILKNLEILLNVKSSQSVGEFKMWGKAEIMPFAKLERWKLRPTKFQARLGACSKQAQVKVFYALHS